METVSLNYYDLQCLGPVGAGDNQVRSYCFRLSFFSHERNGAKTFCGHQNNNYYYTLNPLTLF